MIRINIYIKYCQLSNSELHRIIILFTEYMYFTTENYLYVKKRKLCCKRQNKKNTLANPNRTMNLNNVPTMQLNSPVTCPTNITPILSAPFFEIYTIDPSGALFGQSSYPCNENVSKKYLVN